MKINFVTGNKLKFDIAAAYFVPLGDAFSLTQLIIEIPEIQAETVEEVAIAAAKEAVRMIGEPCIVSDAGLCIEALKGFPGPFLKYANQWLGTDGFLNLLQGTDNRHAYFEDTLAVALPNGEIKTFTRQRHGVIAMTAIETQADWAANELFIPDGYTVPLGRLTYEEQVSFWGDGCWPEVVSYLQGYEEERV